MKEIKSFKNVRKYLNSVEDINMGGCGISALAMYRWLKKNNKLPENTKFAFLYNSKYDFTSNSEINKGNKNGLPVAPYHAVLFHNRKYIDCRGKINVNEYNYKQMINNEEFIKKAVNNILKWNKTFDIHAFDITLAQNALTSVTQAARFITLQQALLAAELLTLLLIRM